jgi:flagellar biosynthetic protein FliO
MSIALSLLALLAAPQEPGPGSAAPVLPLPPEVAGAPLPEPLASRPAPQEDPSPVLIPERPAAAAARTSPLLVERPEAGPSLGGFILSSLLVLGLLVGAFVLLKRYGGRSRLLGGGDAIRVLARKGIGQKQEVFLVEVGPRVFLVGSTKDRLCTLGEFSDPDEVSALRAELPGRAGGSERLNFKESLREGIREAEHPKAPAATYASIADELSEIRKTVQAWRA